jgi:hypothetical protein
LRGNILKIHYDVGGDVIGQVLYEADHGGYIFQWKRKGRNQDYDNLNCDLAFESVIVGNILENPEATKMIILITYLDKETNTKMVSHGYNVTTDELVVLPSVPLFYF